MQLGRASTRGYRLGVVLALIALTPLVGATFFAVHEVMSARAEREAATAVGMTIEELVVVSELRAALTDEHNWTAVVEGVTELGLPIELVNGLTGVDISARLDMARADVDARTGSLGYDDVALSIAAVRDDPDIDLGKELQAILDIERTLATRADGELNRALGQAAGIGDGGTLVNRLRVLEQATLARQAASGSFSEYFGARFATQNGVEQVMALNMDEGRRTWALERLEVLADEDTEAAAAIEVIKNSAAVAQVESDVLRLLTSSVDGTRQSGSLNNVMLELDTIGGTVEAHTVSSDRYSELVAAAGIDASRSVAAAQNAASGRNTQAVAALLAVLVLSALTAVAATRAIARPVRNLARAARKIRDGDTEIGPFPETGPIEIRIAARAINEAAGHLALAEAQALALRDGILDHEALSEQAPGAIGASLQTAVQTLAASMQERERMHAQIQHDASHDALTQLANRRAALEQLDRALARARRSGTSVALLFIDLDGFKEVNDRCGHNAGDAVLQRAGESLAAATRAGDLVGRLGGDEFVVVAEQVVDLAEALSLAERIRRSLEQPMTVDGSTVTIGASIGVAVSHRGEDDATELLHEADLAVYRAKELGKGQIAVCDDDLRHDSQERTNLEQALREALSAGEFELHYHPIVEPVTEHTVGYEALIRWQRPGHGLVAPDQFIPIAERSDLIVAIDRWVVGNVAKQMVLWEAQGLYRDLSMSINVSGRHLTSPSFVENVLGPLDEFGIDPSRIIIEVTESSLLNDLASASIKLEQLRARGIRTAIDDFGTGYTSLAHLRQLPIDILKIDRTYTADESASSLLKLIIDTGHMMGARVTAEGVETRTQAETLTRLGTDDMQGYLYGLPLPVSQMAVETKTTATPRSAAGEAARG